MFCPQVIFLAEHILPEDLNFYHWDFENSEKGGFQVNLVDFRTHENHENVVFLQILPLLDCHKINMGTNFKNHMVKIWILR